MNDPILRGPRHFPAGGPTLGEQVPMTLTVYGGLHYIRGNSAPHFSLTCWAHRKGFPNQCERGGADHDLILKLYPELADVAALHLSDIDGEPMHAEANGWYWLAGALGGMGERYHGGNSEPRKSEGECLAIFARHCRITEDEAMTIRWAAFAAGPDHAREVWQANERDMHARWKREAEAAIEKHGLVVYGDPWQREEATA
jgi:hypothetical protein